MISDGGADIAAVVAASDVFQVKKSAIDILPQAYVLQVKVQFLQFLFYFTGMNRENKTFKLMLLWLLLNVMEISIVSYSIK